VAFTHRVDVRYLEADQQGVVFNMWYLAYFDDALSGLLADGGLAYTALLDLGWDVQVVHTELDWVGPLRWGEPAAIDVALARVGTTSFALQFTARSGDRVACTAETVYVAVETVGWTKVPIPDALLTALGPIEPRRDA
jgi:acyl-CoA thioester hydrolase